MQITMRMHLNHTIFEQTGPIFLGLILPTTGHAIP